MTTYSPFTAAEIAAIRARYPTEGPGKLATAMNRPPRLVSAKARSMGVFCSPGRRKKTARVWTAEEDGLIRMEWPAITRHMIGHTAAKLARRMNVPVAQLRQRAMALGIRSQFLREPPWTDEEIDLLDRLRHLSLSRLRQRFTDAGYHRTETALSVKRARMGLNVADSTDFYTMNGLAALMGVSNTNILGLIRRGQLKATPRTEAVDSLHGGVGDRWLIWPADVKAMITTYPAHVDISRADKFWLIDLLAGNARIHRQESCGAGESGEHTLRIAA